jgi:predicted phosphoribosyltransferase
VRRLHDRQDAGRRLARALERHRDPTTLVLGIPRGGVPVAAVVADALGAELGVIVARKAGAPGDPELAIGAVTPDGSRYVNDDLVRGLEITDADLERSFARAEREARERDERFRRGRAAPNTAGRTVIVVDDGIATGATMRAALRSARRGTPSHLVAAVPVGPAGSRDALAGEADEVVVLDEPRTFFAVSQFYEEFPQVSDDEVGALLAQTKEVPAR